ncbi:MAG: DUF938 domain-containing protein [Alphaproteobacteria bacterium]
MASTKNHHSRLTSAAERNRGPILGVLERVLPKQGTVLEVASGTGNHVVWFAQRLPRLAWQPSDLDPGRRADIAAWIVDSGLENILPPLGIDAGARDWGIDGVQAVLCSNMIHITPWAATLGLIDGASRLLAPRQPLFLYGPFKRGGKHSAPSNEAFDESLRARNPAWGVRDLDEVAAIAEASGFVLDEIVEMPANNLSVVFRMIGGAL